MQDNPRSGRRPRRGGSRRPRRDSGGPGNGNNRSYAAPKVQEPKTLWQKIVAFFKGNSHTNGTTARSAVSARGGNGNPARPDSTTNSPRSFTPRKPEAVEVTSSKLYVGNLSFDASESDLFDLFNGVGKVQNAEIVSHKHTQKSKGFAFVTMQTIDEAKRAVTELHDKDFMGRKLVVSGAKTNDVPRSSGSAGDSRSSDI